MQVASAPKTANRPNLIHIYLESSELTFSDHPSYYPTMKSVTALGERGFSATNIVQAGQTWWTIAGIIASQCGIPLIEPWIQTTRLENIKTFTQDEDFLPNAVCITDLLKRDGYTTGYILTHPLSFAGTKNFLNSHNFDIQIGEHELNSPPDKLRHGWGAEDSEILDRAFQEIKNLHEGERPFAFSIQTIGGHAPEGWTSQPCRNGDLIMLTRASILQGVECTTMLVARFIQQLNAAGILKNSIVVIQNDHLMMRNKFTSILDTMERRNFFVAFGPGVPKEKSAKLASMIDVYPTILEFMGYKLASRQAVLGISLRSKQPTLVEQYGIEDLNRANQQDHTLRYYLWGFQNKIKKIDAQN